MTDQAIHDHANPSMHEPRSEQAQLHIVTPAQYLVVYLILIALTALTCAAAFVDLKWANAVIALAIACTQVVIVVLFDMHVAYQSRLIKLTIGAGVFMFLVMVTMTLTDYISRSWGMW